jgi:hypothetical protein
MMVRLSALSTQNKRRPGTTISVPSNPLLLKATGASFSNENKDGCRVNNSLKLLQKRQFKHDMLGRWMDYDDEIE